MLNSHGPLLGVCRVRPVDGGVQQHGASDGDDGANGAFRDGIVVMSTDASEAMGLSELRAVLGELLGGKGRTVVRGVGLGYPSDVATREVV